VSPSQYQEDLDLENRGLLNAVQLISDGDRGKPKFVVHEKTPEVRGRVRSAIYILEEGNEREAGGDKAASSWAVSRKCQA
jgi:hypothetical protein